MSRQAAEAEGRESIKDWEGNGRADELARGLCKSIQTQVDSSGERNKAQHGELLQRMAVAAGWALRHWPETAGKGKTRGTQRATTKGLQNGAIGPHPVKLRVSGGLECTQCRLRASTPSSIKSLRSKPCMGTTMSQCHASHQMRWSSGVPWCCTCGRYTSRIPLSLREPCPRRPLSEAGRNVLNRRRRGLPPTTAAYLARVSEEANIESQQVGETIPPQDTGHGPEQPDGRRQFPETGHHHHHRHDLECGDVHDGLCYANDDRRRDLGEVHYVDSRSEMAMTAPSSGHDAQSSSGTQRPRATSHAGDEQCQDIATHNLLNLGLEAGLRPRPRIRLTGKQRPPGVIEDHSISRTSPTPRCSQPNITAAWTRRMSMTKLPIPWKCNVCSGFTRTTCSTCQKSLCLHCAKARRPCNPIG